jgi:methylmalonyl-CoA mutase
VIDLADTSLYVMTPEYGAPTQLGRSTCSARRLHRAPAADRRGSEDALRGAQAVAPATGRPQAATPVPSVDRGAALERPGLDQLYQALRPRLVGAEAARGGA